MPYEYDVPLHEQRTVNSDHLDQALLFGAVANAMALLMG